MARWSLCLVVLIACGRAGLGGDAPVTQPSSVPCPELVRQPFHEIAAETHAAARVTCDGLLWADRADTLHVSLAGQTPRTLGTQATQVKVSPSGKLVAWFDEETRHLASVIGGGEHLGLSTAVDTFFLVGPDGTERLVGAGAEGELTALDETGVTTPLAMPVGALTYRWVADHGDAVLVATQASLFAVSGSRRPTIDLGVMLDVQNDRVTLSPDGQLAIIEPRQQAPCGDTFCVSALGATRVLSTLTGAELTTSAQLFKTDGLTDAPVDVRFAADDGHAFATGDSGGVLVVDSTFGVHRFAIGRLVAPPNGNRVITGDTHTVAEPMQVHDLLTGASRDVFTASEAVLVSRDGVQVVSSDISGTCIQHTDNYACRQQLWNLYGGTTTTPGAAWTMTSLQPVQPLWLSNEGDLLAFGALLDAPPPATAADDVIAPWRVWLVAADGTRTGLGSEPAVTVGTAFRRPVIATLHDVDLVSLANHTRTTLATAAGTMRLLLNDSSSFIAAAGQEDGGETLWGGTVVDP